MSPASFCPSCGSELNAGGRFCKGCGTQTGEREIEPAAVAHAQRAMSGAPPPAHPAAAPAVPEPAVRPWLAIGLGAGALALVAATIAVLALSSGGDGGASIHPAAVVTVTTPGQASTATPTTQSSSRVSRSPSTSTPATQPITQSRVNFSAYRAQHINAQIPSGWKMLENEAQKSGYLESKWQSPSGRGDSVLIDTSPATDLSLQEDAAPVHRALEAASGYHEISYGPGDLAGLSSWMWVFEVSGDERVDYFFNSCGQGFGVLGSTRASRFAAMRATFRTVAQSTHAVCE